MRRALLAGVVGSVVAAMTAAGGGVVAPVAGAASQRCANVTIRNGDGSVFTGTRSIVATGVRCSTARKVVRSLLSFEGEGEPETFGFRCVRRRDLTGGSCRDGRRRIAYRYRARASVRAAAVTTYAADCGSTWYLDVRPRSWSSGCTGGAFNLVALSWSHWGGRVARGSGTTALRDPLCRPSCPRAKVFRYPARITLSRPRICDDRGERRRYFSVVAVRVRWARGNPFHARPGWRTRRFAIAGGGECRLVAG